MSPTPSVPATCPAPVSDGEPGIPEPVLERWCGKIDSMLKCVTTIGRALGVPSVPPDVAHAGGGGADAPSAGPGRPAATAANVGRNAGEGVGGVGGVGEEVASVSTGARP
ncbi:MAG: hypothetical protein KF787_00415 [Phycisphaeraceae bacterium]|nr:hypothetical protein [Phycisphaerae bacterium]MBX3391085.1 hypothetical protein [Phycisphaeraceae bacterium]